MHIEYPEGAPKLNDPRIEQVLEYLGSYQQTLRELFAELSDESKAGLSRIPNPHLATGPTEVLVCTNGAVATIRNGFDSTDITVQIAVPEEPKTTMVEYFNSRAEHFFTLAEEDEGEGNAVVFSTTAPPVTANHYSKVLRGDTSKF